MQTHTNTHVHTQVVKAKMQISQTHHGLMETIQMVLQERHGAKNFTTNITGGLYRGFGMTLFREIPFAMIQFPLYEYGKRTWSEYQGSEVNPLQAAACGSLSGAIAGGLTTPLDVLKTRLMLGVDQNGQHYHGVRDVLSRLLATEGPMALLNGVQPRVFWISIGGFVFFGAYEFSKSVVKPILGWANLITFRVIWCALGFSPTRTTRCYGSSTYR